MTTTEEDKSSGDVESRLRAAWQDQRTAEVCGILVGDVMPRCVRWLLGRFGLRSLSYEDAEDSFHTAIEGVLKQRPSSVTNPYDYVFTSAKNAALAILSERQHYVHFDPDWEGREDSSSEDNYSEATPICATDQWLPEAVEVVIEAALDAEITARDGQLKALLKAAVSRLAPRRRQVIELLLEYGADARPDVLAEISGLSKSGIKSHKSRALEDLRSLLPAVAEEMGISLNGLLAGVPEVGVKKPRPIPSAEDETELLP